MVYNKGCWIIHNISCTDLVIGMQKANRILSDWEGVLYDDGTFQE